MIMQTENLNEMIQQVSNEFIAFDEPDFIYTLPRKKLMYSDVKNGALTPEKPVIESTIPHVEIIPESTDSTEVDTNHYQPESEEALIAYTTDIHNKVQTFSIGGYWEIGRTINSFYRGKYGTRELERISKATGIGRDTLNKMCKFAKQYSRDQVEALLSGTFPISWFHISQNLSVEPDKMIRVYQETGDPKQFHNVIMKLKDSQESRGKSKSASIAAPEVVSEPSTVVGVSAIGIPREESGDKPITTVTIDPIPDDHSEELINLRAENENLRKELESTKIQLDDVNRLFHEAALDIEAKHDLIDRLRRTLKQVYGMVENGSNHANILSDVDWRVLG
jgi:hypothetical protein